MFFEESSILEVKTDPLVIDICLLVLGIVLEEGYIKHLPCTPSTRELVKNKLDNHQSRCSEPVPERGSGVVGIHEHSLGEYWLLVCIKEPL